MVFAVHAGLHIVTVFLKNKKSRQSFRHFQNSGNPKQIWQISTPHFEAHVQFWGYVPPKKTIQIENP